MTSRNKDNLTLGLLAIAAALGVAVECQTNRAFKPAAEPSPSAPTPQRSSRVAIPPNLKRLPHQETLLPFRYPVGLDTRKYVWEMEITTNLQTWTRVAWNTNDSITAHIDRGLQFAFFRMKGTPR